MLTMDRDLERYTKENAILREILRETNQRLEEKIHEFSLFRMVADTINRLMTRENSLKLLLAKIIDIIGATNGSIMLIDENSGQLLVEAASGTKDSNPSQPKFPVGRGVAGWVAQESKSLMIEDVRYNKQFFENAPALESSNIRALLCLPLIYENQTIGVLNVSSDQPNTFSLNTERILHIIAGQIAIAIANTRSWILQKQKEKHLEEKNQELMEMKKQLEEAQAQLMKAQKLEAIKQLAISMHHEINNPLTTIYSCTQLIEAHAPTDDQADLESLSKIKESCRRINDIVYKMANLQDVVLTDYISDRKMIDIDRSFADAERVEKENNSTNSK